MNNSSNKETINLLDLLSDSDTDVSDLVLTPKKKVKRKHRRGNAVKMKQSEPCGCGKSDMRIISLWLVAVLITFWLIALSWLAVILYGEIKKMDVSIKSGEAHARRENVIGRYRSVAARIVNDPRGAASPVVHVNETGAAGRPILDRRNEPGERATNCRRAVLGGAISWCSRRDGGRAAKTVRGGSRR